MGVDDEHDLGAENYAAIGWLHRAVGVLVPCSCGYGTAERLHNKLPDGMLERVQRSGAGSYEVCFFEDRHKATWVSQPAL